jgi:glutamate-1-semialdehyde 2,1-aminomutase
VDGARFRRFAQALLRQGVYISPSAALHSVTCLAHQDGDIAKTVAAVGEALDEIKKGG